MVLVKKVCDVALYKSYCECDVANLYHWGLLTALSPSLFTCLLELLRELSEDLLLVEELALVAMLEVLRDPLPHVTWQLPIN